MNGVYIREFGVRKVEANALVIDPEAGRALCRSAIRDYVSEADIEAYRENLREERMRIKPILAQRIAEHYL